MAKRSRSRSPRTPDRGADVADVPVVGPRQPCPCGSGKRYKLCHGRARRSERSAAVSRPFEGLPAEREWVALRELVPAATASVRLTGEHAGTDVAVCTVLPFAAPGLVRPDGAIWLGLQVEPAASDDPSRDLGATLTRALDAEPGDYVGPEDPGPETPRLQDLLDLDAPFEITVYDDFAFWAAGQDEPDPDVVASRERADTAAHPTERLSSVDAAYWCRIGDRWHLRWVMAEEEERLLDALARLAAADSAGVGPGSRLVGSFRAHGLVVPVWDLAADTPAAAVEEPAATLAGNLAEALAETGPLTTEQRSARAGLVSRQVTLR